MERLVLNDRERTASTNGILLTAIIDAAVTALAFAAILLIWGDFFAHDSLALLASKGIFHAGTWLAAILAISYAKASSEPGELAWRGAALAIMGMAVVLLVFDTWALIDHWIFRDALMPSFSSSF